MTLYFEKQLEGVSREELLKNVWKFDFEVDTRAIDDVLKGLEKKVQKRTSG
jgi:DNA-binding response OmpR family regulator